MPVRFLRISIISLLILTAGCSYISKTTPMSQELQDEYVVNGFISVFWYIWDQNIAGQTVGEKDITVNGPEGGFVHVTGSNWYDIPSGLYTLNILCEYYNYHKISEYEYDLVITGSVHAVGSYTNLYTNVNFTADSVSFMGNIGSGSSFTEVHSTGSYFDFVQETNLVSGIIDGRDVEWNY